uniref:ATPase AAA-type core domain-containing protein n=1 Tax=Prasinoderma singulare TaxID=676789 RepID=A0A7S3BSW4_9VIRI|mmetsp:Transcript_2883/g.8774  ORF Transcript_2883/g.8774 Transcript_2883/m.8774 type:complete len:121 (+) Transcript_2883:1-363(+)
MWRSYLTGFGFDTRQQNTEIAKLSDGQKSRLVFSMISMKPVNLLLLDEPTNHLDTDSIDGLAEAINAFEGGVVLVSHDFRLIDKVAREIWECKEKKVRKFDGDIRQYKAQLAKRLKLQRV